MQENFFDRLLDLGTEWSIEKVEFDEITKEIDIYVQFNLEAYKEKSVDTYHGIYDYREYRRWRHLDILQYKCFIKAKIPRLMNQDGKIKSLDVPWADTGTRHTLLFEKFAIDVLLATRNQTKSAELLRCGFNVVNNIIHTASARGILRRDKDIIYNQLSVDEKSHKSNHQYVTVLSCPDTGHIIDIAKDRTKKAYKDLLNNCLSEKQKSEVKFISMDMWEAYMNGTQEILPKAKIVHDRFHLIKYLNDAIDKVRRRESKDYEELKNSRYSVLKNSGNLTEKQYYKFEDVLRINTKVSLAWRLRECFKSLFQSENYQSAFNKYQDWLSFCVWEKIPEVMKVAEMFNRHITGVCNALVENLSNAMAERLNGKIQEIKTIGRGYATFENFRSALLFFYGGLDLYPHK
jgi:transposase